MKGSTWVKLGIVCLLLVGIVLGLKLLGIDLRQMTPERVRDWVLSLGAFAPVVYLLVYAQPIIPLPASILTIAAGLAFGPSWGTLAALVGSGARACSEFLVARLLGRKVVGRLLKGKIATLDQKLGENSFKAVLLLRLIPNVPFDVLNYGLGFSRVRFGPYILATVLGMIPVTLALVYFGYSLSDPKNIWKLGIAVLVIVGLVVGQWAWKARGGKRA